MDGALISTYTLIYTFLIKQSHTKAAEAVKKAAKDIVVLKADLVQDGPTLDEIIREWKQRQPKDTDSTSSSSESESESESETPRHDAKSSKSSEGYIQKTSKFVIPTSNSDSDSDSSSESDTTPVQKPKKIKSCSSSSQSSSESESTDAQKISTAASLLKLAPKKPPTVSAPSSSEWDSDSDSEDEKQIQTLAKKPNLPPKDPGSSGPESDSEPSTDSPESDSDELSDSELLSEKENSAANNKSRKPLEHESSRTLTSGADSDSDEDDDSDAYMSDVATKENTAKNGLVGEKKEEITSESSSGSSSSSEEEEDSGKDKTTKQRPKVLESSSSDSDERPPVPKKRKTAEDSSMVVANASRSTSRSTSVFSSAKSTSNESKLTNGNGNNKTGPRKSNTPFKRVDPSKMSLDVVMDNRYEVKAGPTNDYGHRAHQDLIVTRGAGFRKEKNKKKRGSYRGGEITLESHSFKFAD